MSALKLALAAAAVLLAVGCLPVTTKAPLGTTTGLGEAPALLGIWKGKDPDDKNTIYLHFLPAEGGAMPMLAVTVGKDHSGLSVFAARETTLGNYHYLNVRIISCDGKPPDKDDTVGNIPVLYKIGDGKLTLYRIGEKVAKDAITKGVIDGTVEPGDYGDAIITAAPEKLDAFFASPEGAKLFTEKIATLKKVD